MNRSWPKVTCSVEQRITATHSLPRSIGSDQPHDHSYLIRAGWTHEVNPEKGVTKPMRDMRHDFDMVVALLNGAELNLAMTPFPPTAENMACWVMAKLPAYWMFVEIECYEGFRVRVEGTSMRREWTEAFR